MWRTLDEKVRDACGSITSHMIAKGVVDEAQTSVRTFEDCSKAQCLQELAIHLYYTLYKLDPNSPRVVCSQSDRHPHFNSSPSRMLYA